MKNYHFTNTLIFFISSGKKYFQPPLCLYFYCSFLLFLLLFFNPTFCLIMLIDMLIKEEMSVQLYITAKAEKTL